MREARWEDDRVVGYVAYADKPNINGITYPKHVLEKMVEDVKEQREARQLYFYTPEAPGPKLSLACGTVEELWVDEQGMMARVKPLLATSPFGELVKANKIGLTLATSGSLNDDGVVQDDAILYTISFARIEDLI